MNEATKKKIDDLIEKNDVCLFMKGTPEVPQCGFSLAVSNILKHLKIDFKGINVLEDNNLREGIKQYSDWPTIPKLYIKKKFLGGCDIVKEMFEKGELQKIGTTISFSSDRDYFTINVKGFDEHLNKSLEYVNEFITHVKGDDDNIKKLVESAKSGRKIEKREPSTVGRALRDFVAYGDQSHSLRRMTVKEIKNTKYFY